MKIVVLAGGLSPERDVSLSSGSLIANALMEAGHEVVLVDVYLGIKSSGGAQLRSRALGSAPYTYTIPAKEPDLEQVKRQNGNREQLIGEGVLELCMTADTTFLALHGAMGENGQLQAVLDCYGIPYTGSGYTGSLLAMDKDITKQLLRQNGVPTADWVLWQAGDAPETAKQIGFPCVVKPCSCGSSVGVSLVREEAELYSALQSAMQYEKAVLVERMVQGREFSVGILEGKALPPIEIIPLQGFYDYQNKYQAELTREVCPAQLSEEQTAQLQALALRAHQALRLGSYSRVDFLMEQSSGQFFCLEANTLPGMTPVSLLPQEAEQAGISYVALCERISQLSLR